MIVSSDRDLVNEILDSIAYERQPDDPKKTYLGEPFPEGRGTIDFNKIVPMPNYVYKGDLPFKHNYGKNNWYDWSIENWGTKWNAYDMDRYLGGNVIRWQTAWSGVVELMKTLSKKFPTVEFDYKWADEDTGHNVGHVTIKAGNILMQNIPKGGSREAYELCFEIKPEYSKNYVWNEAKGRYDWIEDEEEDD